MHLTTESTAAPPAPDSPPRPRSAIGPQVFTAFRARLDELAAEVAGREDDPVFRLSAVYTPPSEDARHGHLFLASVGAPAVAPLYRAEAQKAHERPPEWPVLVAALRHATDAWRHAGAVGGDFAVARVADALELFVDALDERVAVGVIVQTPIEQVDVPPTTERPPSVEAVLRSAAVVHELVSTSLRRYRRGDGGVSAALEDALAALEHLRTRVQTIAKDEEG